MEARKFYLGKIRNPRLFERYAEAVGIEVVKEVETYQVFATNHDLMPIMEGSYLEPIERKISELIWIEQEVSLGDMAPSVKEEPELSEFREPVEFVPLPFGEEMEDYGYPTWCPLHWFENPEQRTAQRRGLAPEDVARCRKTQEGNGEECKKVCGVERNPGNQQAFVKGCIRYDGD